MSGRPTRPVPPMLGVAERRAQARVGLMFFGAIFLVTVALAFLVPTGESQTVLPEDSAFLTACAIAESLGADQKLPVTNCRLVGQAVDGNRAQVAVSVKVHGQGRFTVTVNLFRSAWGMHTVAVTPGG